jgi:hypothetical protein
MAFIALLATTKVLRTIALSINWHFLSSKPISPFHAALKISASIVGGSISPADDLLIEQILVRPLAIRYGLYRKALAIKARLKLGNNLVRYIEVCAQLRQRSADLRETSHYPDIIVFPYLFSNDKNPIFKFPWPLRHFFLEPSAWLAAYWVSGTVDKV